MGVLQTFPQAIAARPRARFHPKLPRAPGDRWHAFSFVAALCVAAIYVLACWK